MENKIQNLLIENEKLKNDNKKILEEKEEISKNCEVYKEVIKEELKIKNLDNFMDFRSKRRVYRRQNTAAHLLDNDDDFELRKKSNILESFFNSSIIRENNDVNFIYKLFKDKNFINSKLIYRNSENFENFHKSCDNKDPTLSIYKIQIQKNSNNINCIFGGYSSIDWESSNKFKNDSKAFIFSITDKKVFKAKPLYNSIVCCDYLGPSFGIKKNSNQPELFIKENKGYYYSTDTFGDSERICTKGQMEFNVLKLEVYKISFNDI